MLFGEKEQQLISANVEEATEHSLKICTGVLQ